MKIMVELDDNIIKKHFGKKLKPKEFERFIMEAVASKLLENQFLKRN